MAIKCNRIQILLDKHNAYAHEPCSPSTKMESSSTPPIRVTQLHFRTDQENNGDLQTAQKPLRAEEYLSHITALRISCTTKQLAHSGIELPERTA